MARKGEKLSPELINTIKILRMNGLSFEKIGARLDVSKATAHNYSADVQVLPKELQRDPWEVMKDMNVKIQQKEAKYDRAAFQNAISEREYWIDEHTPGDQWKGPLDIVSLDELIRIQQEPTDYISPLPFSSWFNYYMAEWFFGPGGQASLSQISMSDFLDRNRNALVTIFRGGGKTIMIESKATRKLCETKNNTYAIQSETIDVAKERLMVIKAHLQSNPKIIADYGYLPWDKTWRNRDAPWSTKEITVKRDVIKTDASLKALSWKGGRLVGGHFDGVIFDDPWSMKLEENNEDNFEKWFRWYDSSLIGSINDGAFQWIIGTRKGINDIYREFIDRGLFAYYKQPAFYEFPTDYSYIKNDRGVIVDVDIRSNDWMISDSSVYDIKYFLMKRMLYKDEAQFQLEMQLNPVPSSGRAFKWKDLRFIEDVDEFYGEERFRFKNKIFAAMDMAVGESDKAHYTALVVMGFKNGNYYVLQTYMQKGGSKSDKVKMMHRAKAEFPTLSRVYIEADLSQSTYVKDLKRMVRGVNIMEFYSRHEEKTFKKMDTGKLTSKQARIVHQLEDVIEFNKLYICKSISHYKEFEREFKDFPKSKYDDLIDTIAACVSKMQAKAYTIWGFSG